jgi:hypothetical protein
MQTHTTPVLLGYKDRAEIAGSEFVTAAALSVLEGVVIVEKKAPEPTLLTPELATDN